MLNFLIIHLKYEVIQKFIAELTGDDKVLEHIEQKPSTTGWLPQDVWIIRKMK